MISLNYLFFKKYRIDITIGILIGIFSVFQTTIIFGVCDQPPDEMPSYCNIYKNELIGKMVLPFMMIGMFILFINSLISRWLVILTLEPLKINIEFLIPILLILVLIIGIILCGTASILIGIFIRKITHKIATPKAQ
jgi:hypothetical protein